MVAQTLLGGRTRTRFAVLALLVAAIVAGLSAVVPSAKTAGARAALSCGDTVTSNVTLTADLTSCGAFGLNVGANSITIDLNGHTIDGSGSGDGINNTGHKNVVIKNGTVTDFSFGVRLQGAASGNVVQKIRAEGNVDFGILSLSADNVKLIDNTLFSNDRGIDISGNGLELTGNVAEANASQGILLEGGSGSVLSENTALNNGSYGIQVSGFQTSAALTKNTSNGNGADGIFVASSVTAATLTGNNSSFNAALGINAAPGAVTDGGKNVVQDNISAKQCLNIVCTEV